MKIGWTKTWATERIAELTEKIAAASKAIEYAGNYMLHEYADMPGGSLPESQNLNLGSILALCIKANEDNRREIERLHRVFEV